MQAGKYECGNAFADALEQHCGDHGYGQENEEHALYTQGFTADTDNLGFITEERYYLRCKGEAESGYDSHKRRAEDRCEICALFNA